MEPFKENKIANILEYMGMFSTILFILSLLLMFFNHWFGIGFLFIPFGGVCYFFNGLISKKENYTREFITYIKDKINKAKSLEDLLSVEKEFNRLAIKDGMYCLSFPHSLKTIQAKILSQIEILEKINSSK